MFANNRACVQAMVIPVVHSIIRKPEVNPATAVEGALDLANALLEPGLAVGLVLDVHRQLSDTVLALMNMHDDPAVLQSCCEYLRQLAITSRTVCCSGYAAPSRIS